LSSPSDLSEKVIGEERPRDALIPLRAIWERGEW